MRPPQRRVVTQIEANETPTFGVFAEAYGRISFDPAVNRVYVRFEDSGGVVRGATGVAVEGGSSAAATALEIVGQVIRLLFAGDVPTAANSAVLANMSATVGETHVLPVDLTLSCGLPRGSISLHGTKTLAQLHEPLGNPVGVRTTVDGDLEYSNCFGIDGILDAWAQTEQYSEDYISGRIVLGGTFYAEGCSLNYREISVTLGGHPSDIVDRYIEDPYISSGTVFADCADERVLCTFNNTHLSDLDQQAVENICVVQ